MKMRKLFILREILRSKVEIAKRWKSMGYLVEGQAEILDTLNIAQRMCNDFKISASVYITISNETKNAAIEYANRK
jgi:glycerol-3-phosphate dehydrogenase